MWAVIQWSYIYLRGLEKTYSSHAVVCFEGTMIGSAILCCSEIWEIKFDLFDWQMNQMRFMRPGVSTVRWTLELAFKHSLIRNGSHHSFSLCFPARSSVTTASKRAWNWRLSTHCRLRTSMWRQSPGSKGSTFGSAWKVRWNIEHRVYFSKVKYQITYHFCVTSVISWIGHSEDIHQ